MAVETSVRPVLRAERGFYAFMAAAILATIFLGFARTFFLRPWFEGYAAVHAPREMFFYVKGVFFVAWFVLFFAQASLIATGNTALHRTLGLTAFALVPIMVVLGTIGSLVAARRPGGLVVRIRIEHGDRSVSGLGAVSAAARLVGFDHARAPASGHALGRARVHRHGRCAGFHFPHAGLARLRTMGGGLARVSAR